MAPAFGERLLPSVVDELAQSTPERVLYSLAKTKNPADGFEDITALNFAKAVDCLSWYIEENLGRGHSFPTLTYMGPQDLLYGILVLASIKTGYKLLLVSPRNTLEQQLYLLDKTGCGIFVSPPNFPLPVMKQILAARPMRHFEIPDLYYWLDSSKLEGKPYAYTKTFAEAKEEPWVVLHTSGSTGLPKPITQPHGTIAAFDAFRDPPSPEQTPVYPGPGAPRRVYSTFPLFHCAGISMLLPCIIFSDHTLVMGPFPPSVEFINGVILHGNISDLLIIPTQLVDLAREPEYLKNLNRLERVSYGGGPCPEAVGNLVSTKTKLFSGFGTTECGILPSLPLESEDWAYLSISTMLGHEYRYVTGDLYEQVIMRKPELERYQGIFATFPELTEWPMRDLYSKHPTKENVWLYRGRADDIIVYSTGEKLNPIEMEDTINSNPAVTTALVAGAGRFQSSLLVEATKPPTNETERQELLELIWPSVQAANQESPSHGRVHRGMIIFTSPDKPMLRAGKGTVQRKMTLDLYASELDALYKTSEAPTDDTAITATNGDFNVLDTVRGIISSSTEIDIATISPNTDLFELGLDSLQVTVIARELNRFLSAHGKPPSLETKTVYSNPSISALTTVVSAYFAGNAPAQREESDEEKMQRLYELYTENLPISARDAQPKPTDSSVFLITGSTGSLGSYILDALHRNPRIRRIYCLNRGPGSFERQQKSLAAKGLAPLPTNINNNNNNTNSKVQCLDADLSKPYFGLSPTTYKTLLLEQVTHVIHNAWQVDFNLSLASFATHVGSVRRFVDFSAHSRHGAHIFFISSISSVGGLLRPRSRRGEAGIPERIFSSWDAPERRLGYGQSKFVSERVLDAAAREAGVPAVVCRVGQVAGPTTACGVWPRQEWLPSLVASSKYLGQLPASLGGGAGGGVVDWVPVDVLGQSIVELALHRFEGRKDSVGAAVFHAVNPQRTTWAELVPTVLRCLGSSSSSSPTSVIKSVSLEAWVDALRESASRTEDLARNPAAKILGFFEGVAATDKKGEDGDKEQEREEPGWLSTKETLAASQTLAALGPVRGELMENWMRQWSF